MTSTVFHSAGPGALDSPAVVLQCPLCHYNLTGLTNPQCPECGHTFDWAELSVTARHTLPWLFEHRTGPRGYLSTQLRLLWPPTFFRTLRPSHAVHRGRLFLFAAVGWTLIALFALNPHGHVLLALQLWSTSIAYRHNAAVTVDIDLRQAQQDSPNLVPLDITPAAYLQQVAPQPWHRGFWATYNSLRARLLDDVPQPQVYVALTTLLSSFFATIIVLLVLRVSLRHASARSIHVIRALVYSVDILLVPLCLFGFWIRDYIRYHAFQNSRTPDYAAARSLYQNALHALPDIVFWLCLLAAFRLAFAMKRYLNLPHVLGIIAAIATITLFLCYIVLVQFTDLWWRI